MVGMKFNFLSYVKILDFGGCVTALIDSRLYG